MRCPNCGFVGPDHRDVCIKCYLDLREQKKAVGIPVSNSWATHEELLRELGIGQTTTTQSKPTPPSAPSTLASSPTPASEEETLPQTIPTEAAAAPANAISASLKFGKRPSNIATPDLDHGSAQLLFDAAEIELRQCADDSAFELSADKDIISSQRESIKALFGLAEEVLADPSIERELARSQVSSAERTVEASSLSTMLQGIESSITAPVFNLRSAMRDATQRADDQERQEPFRELDRASVAERICAFCIDSMLTLICSYFLTAVLLSSIEGMAFSLTPPQQGAGDPVLFWSLMGAVTCVLMLIYPLVCFTFYRTTLGLHTLSLGVVNERFRRIRNSHALVRALAFPISILSVFGIAVTLVGKRAFHDWLSCTMVCRLPVKQA